jgi:hypothetical protein
LGYDFYSCPVCFLHVNEEVIKRERSILMPVNVMGLNYDIHKKTAVTIISAIAAN